MGATVKVEHVFPQQTNEFSSYYLRQVSLNYEQNRLNDFRYPTTGYRLKLGYDIGGDIGVYDLGGIDFNRLKYSQSFFHSYDDVTFGLQIFAGRYQNRSGIETFESEKFSLGGGNSLRGYHDFSFFGNYRMSFNLESRYRLSQALLLCF